MKTKIFSIIIALHLLSGCAIAKINTDTQRAYMFGIGSYENEKGAKISVLSLPEQLGVK